MTVSTTLSNVTWQGNGGTTVFSFPFLVDDPTTLVVTIIDTVSNTQQVIGSSGYSVTGIGNSNGGTITYPLSGSPIPSTQFISIQRIVPLTQPASYVNQSGFYPNVIEDSFDLITMQVQQVNGSIGFALRAPLTDNVAPNPIPSKSARASQLLGFDANGNPIAAQPSSALISTAIQPFAAASTVAAALNLIGVGTIAYWLGGIGGSANAITATVQNITGLFQLNAGSSFWLIPATTNPGGACNLNINSGGNFPIKVASLTGFTNPIGGELVAGKPTLLWFDGTRHIILSDAMPLYSPLAAGSTTDLGSLGVGYIQVTGSATINLFGATATTGKAFKLLFSGQCTIVNSASIAMPGGVNYVTQPGDQMFVVCTGSNIYTVTNIVRTPAVQVGAVNAEGLAGANDGTTPNTKINWTARRIVVADAGGVGSIWQSPAFNVDCTQIGVINGIRSALAPSTYYYFFAISNGSQIAGWADTSLTAPAFPSGYTQYCYIGAALTDASSHFYQMTWHGDRAALLIGSTGNTTAPWQIASGSQASFTMKIVNVPTGAKAALMSVVNGATAAAAALAPNTNYVATNAPMRAWDSTASFGEIWFDAIFGEVAYLSSSSAGAAYQYGWRDAVNAS
jgi:hypothetical protein